MDTNRARSSLWRENLAQALDVVRVHRMRSGLLILGVAIGISTVLMMVTVLNGLTSKIYRDMASASQPYIFVQKFDLLVEGENAEKQARRPDLTREDAAALVRMCPELERVTFVAETYQNFVVRYGSEKTPPTTIQGASENLPYIFTLTIDQGRFYSAQEVRYHERVVVLGSGPAKDLFKLGNPIGKVVTINGAKYDVVGTLQPTNSIFGSWSNNFVTIPHTAYARDIQGEQDRVTLAATVREGVALERGVEEVTHALRVRRGMHPGEPNNFNVETSESFIDLVKRVTVPIGIVLTIIASIGLLVGGIGVMNVMLISVTERTREIGVRRAIGAGRGDIMLQFLVEAGTLTGIGGVVGVVGGIGLAWLVSLLLRFPFSVSPAWTAIALAFSVVVGIGFGLYPARRAGDMDPVNALRYE